MNDVAVELAWNGCSLHLGLFLGEAFLFDLSEEHPSEYSELYRHRYVATLLRPMWGVLFTNWRDEDADN